MKNLLSFLFLIILLPLAGCSLLAPQIDKAADAGARAVKFYCENLDEPNRDNLRKLINAKAAPNAVLVQCASDAPRPDATP